MIRTQIQFEEEDFRRLKKQAASEDCSIAAFVRECVKRVLDERERSSKASSVMEIAGKYRSGHKDLSRNHDSYLSDGW